MKEKFLIVLLIPMIGEGPWSSAKQQAVLDEFYSETHRCDSINWPRTISAVLNRPWAVSGGKFKLSLKSFAAPTLAIAVRNYLEGGRGRQIHLQLGNVHQQLARSDHIERELGDLETVLFGTGASRPGRAGNSSVS